MKRKGQLVFEFIVATLFFLAIVIYTINYLNSTVFMFSRGHESSMMESSAWRMSEVLVRRPGIWTGSGSNMVPSELGLASDWPVLSEDKIMSMGAWCAANRERMMTMLDVDPVVHGVAVEAKKYAPPGEVVMMSCGSPPAEMRASMSTRIGLSDADNRLLKVTVWYW